MTLVPPATLSPFSNPSTRTVVLGVSLRSPPSGKARRTPQEPGVSPTLIIIIYIFATTHIRHDHEWGRWRRLSGITFYFSYCGVAWCVCPYQCSQAASCLCLLPTLPGMYCLLISLLLILPCPTRAAFTGRRREMLVASVLYTFGGALQVCQ